MQTKPFVWTYTNINTYDDVCPRQFFMTYIKKAIPYKATPEMDFGNRVHDAFERRVGGNVPLPSEMRQWEKFAAPLDGSKARVELKLGITREGRPTGFFDADVFGRVKVDTIVMNGTAGVMFDWKTGNSKYEKPFELEIGAMFLKAHNPHLTKVSGSYVWLKDDRVGRAYDLSDFNSTWARVNNIVEKIEDNMATGEWEERRGPLCAWCRDFSCSNNTNQKRD